MIPKFRAWHKAEKRMITDIEEMYSKGIDGVITEIVEVGKDVCRLETDVILMQSTGLKDKNGKEMFDGDIVKWNDDNDIFRIYWDESGAGWSIRNREDDDDFAIGKKSSEPMGNVSEENLEVIGNIHKNPKLIKGGN